jgi:hypothetical protein
VRSAGGTLDEQLCWYAMPDWLLRLVEGAAA